MSISKIDGIAFALVTAILIGTAPAVGQSAPSTVESTSAEERRKEEIAAWTAAEAAAIPGPSAVTLGSEAKLALPAGRLFVPQAEGRRALRSLGNTVNSNFLGLVVAKGADWIAVISYVQEGHIKDDEAQNWDVDALLSELKEGTDASNIERRQRGFPELLVDGWAERPAYDGATHRLVWALASHSVLPDGTITRGINYNTYLLGREGYLSLNLVTDADSLSVDKEVAKDLLARLAFVEGRRYADFDASTDHMAEYGLAALIGGVAAKKLGLLAVIAAFAVKFAKVGIALAFGIAYGGWKWVRRLTGRKPEV